MEALGGEIKEREKAWEDLISNYEQKVHILGKVLEEINKEFEELEIKKANLAAKHGDTTADESDLIQINEGGRVITARRGTLTYQKGTMIEALFGGRWGKEIHRDGFGHIFLDANPECFQRIVNYLSALKHSLEDEISQYLNTDRDLQLIFDRTLTYFEIKQTPLSTKIPSTLVTKKDRQQSSTKCLQTTQQTQKITQPKIHGREQKSLKTSKEELQRSKRNLGKEQGFMHSVCAQSPNDIVNFDVRGTMMTAKRSTLRIFKDSRLDRQFDDDVWPGKHGGTPSIEK
eukprot:1868091-Ditylum_brightwellii.AAC.1